MQSPYKQSATLTKVVYLSELQQLASKRCVNAYQNKKNILIFAVCGAGKTEIVYDVILKAINDRKIICFTTPRKDVVLEILPRFKRDFDNVAIVGLYGGSTEKGNLGSLYVTTTHQLINFYHLFDLIIVDEVDAFPFYNNKMLESFIIKAKKPTAPIIYLTATPTNQLKRLMYQKKLDYFIIPSRYHRKPIPLPKIQLVNNLNKGIRSGNLPIRLRKWIKTRNEINKQTFLFVPSIKVGKQLEHILAPVVDCQFVSSESPNRRELIHQFRAGKLNFLITTTILERGVTVSNVDVAIICACDSVFDERAIVQIIGRAGRDKNHPTADVCLFSEYYTKAMKDSVKHIKDMNKRNLKRKNFNGV